MYMAAARTVCKVIPEPRVGKSVRCSVSTKRGGCARVVVYMEDEK